MPKVTTELFGELAVMPFQAEVPVKETLEFLTDVLESYNSTEERLQLREKARRSFIYKIPLQAWQTASAFNTEYGALRKDWAVPIWTEGQYLGNVAPGVSVLECDTILHDLRASSLAMLYSPCGEFQIIEIDHLTDTEIFLLSETIGIRSAWLLPVRVGWIKGSIDKPTNGYISQSTINFIIYDLEEALADEPAQYLGDDIYFDLPLLESGNLSTNISQQQDIIDFELGPVENRTNWNHARFSKPFYSVLTTKEEIKQYREFLYRRAGKFRQFWFPTFENNIRILNTGNIASDITIKSDSFIDYASLRTNIAFQTLNNWNIRTIISSAQIDQYTVGLTLSSPLNVDAENINRSSFLGLNRLDSDRIELSFSGNGVLESSIPIIELQP